MSVRSSALRSDSPKQCLLVLASIRPPHLHRVNDDQVTVFIFESKNLDRHSGLIITENKHPIRLRQIAWRWLYESQTSNG
jgi:hypothetical protein